MSNSKSDNASPIENIFSLFYGKYKKKMSDFQKSFEESFNKLKEKNQNTAENLLQWMKDSQIIAQTKEAEEKAMRMLNEAKDKSNVDFDHFKAVVAKMAEDNKTQVEDMFAKLSSEGPKFISAMKAGLTSALDAGMSAFKEGMK